MQTLKKSKYTGVTLNILNGKDYYWMCRVQGKNGKLLFWKRFPFTKRYEKIAAQTYKQKINELQLQSS